MSKNGLRNDRVWRVPINWIRRFLIESIYRRLSMSSSGGGGFHPIAHPRLQLSRSLKLPSGVVLLMSKQFSKTLRGTTVLNVRFTRIIRVGITAGI